jgi:MFS transporter, FSR family, fosmidomycin resistance protein
MPGDAPTFRSHVTLVGCMLLHGFTHAYGTMLVPLYLPMQVDLRLRGVGAAALIVTTYGLVYCLASYPAGVLADRSNRKVLLGVGLIVNALAILLMGHTRRYEMLILLGVLGGLAGTLFHPASTALSTAHYPKSPGMAIGVVSIGAAIGFFAGPRYAGWRADVAGWQRPLVEAGLFGIACGIVFLFVAKEVRSVGATPASPLRGSPNKGSATRASPLHWRIAGIALVIAGRDFAGIASLSLVSLYLQKARGMTVGQAGLIIGSMMLIAIVANPLAVYASSGRRRLPTLFGLFIAGGMILTSIPFVNVTYVLLVLCAFQAAHLGSFAVGEAAMLERVDPAVRGRVVGVLITVAGMLASSSPWLMGVWTDALASRATDPRAYALPFGVLGCLHMLASMSVFLIRRLAEPPVSAAPEPMAEISPATMEVVG